MKFMPWQYPTSLLIKLIASKILPSSSGLEFSNDRKVLLISLDIMSIVSIKISFSSFEEKYSESSAPLLIFNNSDCIIW